jgi:hypothetical protein
MIRNANGIENGPRKKKFVISLHTCNRSYKQTYDMSENGKIVILNLL